MQKTSWRRTNDRKIVTKTFDSKIFPSNTMKHVRFFAFLTVFSSVIMQVPLLGAAETVVPKPKGVCETFTKNPEIIAHNGQKQLRNFTGLVRLPAELIDGDTITVTGKRDNKFKVRFVAAFAPELDEKGGKEAADFVRKQIEDAGGKVVLFHDGPRTVDQYSRQLRLVCIINSKGELVCLDELLVRNGLAEATRSDNFYYSSKPYFKQIKPKKKPDEPDFPKYDLNYLENIKKKP